MAYQGYVQARESPIRQNIGVYEGDARRQERLSKDIGTGMKELGESVKSYGVNKREQTKLQFFDQKRRLDTALAGHKLALSEADRKAYKTHGGRQAALDAYNKELEAWRKESSTPAGVAALNPDDIGRRYSIFKAGELGKYAGKATDQIAKVSPMTFGEWLTERDHVDPEWLNRDHGATLSVIKEVISEIQGRDVGDMFDKVGVKSQSGTDSGSVVEETADGKKEPPPAKEEVVVKEGVDEVIEKTSGKGRTETISNPLKLVGMDTTSDDAEEESSSLRYGEFPFLSPARSSLKKKVDKPKEEKVYLGDQGNQIKTLTRGKKLFEIASDPGDLRGTYLKELIDRFGIDQVKKWKNTLNALAKGQKGNMNWKPNGNYWVDADGVMTIAEEHASLREEIAAFNDEFARKYFLPQPEKSTGNEPLIIDGKELPKPKVEEESPSLWQSLFPARQ